MTTPCDIRAVSIGGESGWCLTLPDTATVQSAADVLARTRELLERPGPVLVDGRQVESLDAAVLQVLLALERAFTIRRRQVTFALSAECARTLAWAGARLPPAPADLPVDADSATTGPRA
jgi:anti-anti-sigma regulatory factor